MARIIIPFLNCLNLIKIPTQEIPQYVSKFIDDYKWSERLLPSQYGVEQYYQPWQNNDVISLQFQNSAGQINVDIVNCQGDILLSFIMIQKQQNKYEPSTFIYESNTALTPLAQGRYLAIVRIGVPVVETYISEAFYVAPKHETTLLFEYVNRSFYGNMIFETGFKPSLRLRGHLKMLTPLSKDTLYEDQVLDMVMVKSKPYRIFKLTLYQLPDWMANTVNWVLGCSGLKIDGVYYSKNDEAELEASVPTYVGALQDYTIDLRESIYKNSKITDTEINTNDQLTLLVNVESKGFADTSEDASSSIVTFLDVE